MSLTSQLHGSAQVLVEGEGHKSETQLKAFLSAAVTLTLGILGSSVLPVPFAFSRLGVLGGLLVASIVSLANALTGTLLLRAAGHLRAHTFESLAYKAAGRGWKALTEVSLVFLLFGTLCGDYALLADIGKKAIVGLFPGAPSWIHDDPGRIPMIALGLVIVFPLSCLRRIRELEYAAMAGVGLVIVLAGVIVQSAASAGFPAIHSGELPLTKISLNADLPEAVAVLSFAFYVQPMLLPLLKEMPQGKVGVNLTCKAVQVVTMAVATVVYATVGVFAAARYGLSTEGDVLVNKWLPGRWDGALDGLVAIYLSLSMVPMVMTMRYQLDSLLTGEYAPYLLRREVSLTVFSLLTSLAVALCWPTAAEKMFAVTGATAVCLVCYIIPVVIHLSLYFRRHPSSAHDSSPSGPQRGGSFTVLGSSGTEPAGAVGPGSDLVVTVLPPPRPPHLQQHSNGGEAQRPQQAAGRPKFTAQQAGPLKAAGAAAESSLQPPAGAAAAAAQPLPVQGVRAGSVTNVSFDSWLVTGRSRDSLDMAGEAAHLGGSPTLHASHLPPLPAQQRQRPRQQCIAQAVVGANDAASSNGSSHSGMGTSFWEDGLEEPLLQRSAAQSRQHAQSGEGRNGGPYKAAGRHLSGAYPCVTDLQGQGCVRQALMLTQHVGLPVLVMLVGTAFSLGALWLSVAALVR